MVPDSARVEWLNAVTAQVWPFVERAAVKFLMKDKLLDSLLNSTTFWRPRVLANAELHVVAMSLGQVGRGPACSGAEQRVLSSPALSARCAHMCASASTSRWVPIFCLPVLAPQEPPRVTGVKTFPRQAGMHNEVRNAVHAWLAGASSCLVCASQAQH
jgi:hypothetical protein